MPKLVNILESLEGQLALPLVAISMDGASGELFVIQKVVERICGALGLNKDQSARGRVVKEGVEDCLLLLVVLDVENILLDQGRGSANSIR